MPSRLSTIIVFVLGAVCVLWALTIPIKERFGSDWNSAFWGPMIWTGWNYGYPIGREAPRPEKTPPFEPRA
jgi:hypothetical protein